LNDGKTELAWFGKRSRLRRLADLDCTVTVDTSVIQPKDVVRDLGVVHDSELSMKQHIAKVTSTSAYTSCGDSGRCVVSSDRKSPLN